MGPILSFERFYRETADTHAEPGGAARARGGYQRLVAPITRGLDEEIRERGESLGRDMELRERAHRMGDRESVGALEFRMRETYGELLPRVVVRGLINLVPHLLALCALYYLLPVVELGGVRISTISFYITAAVIVMLLRHYRAWRGRNRPASAGAPGK